MHSHIDIFLYDEIDTNSKFDEVYTIPWDGKTTYTYIGLGGKKRDHNAVPHWKLCAVRSHDISVENKFLTWSSNGVYGNVVSNTKGFAQIFFVSGDLTSTWHPVADYLINGKRLTSKAFAEQYLMTHLEVYEEPTEQELIDIYEAHRSTALAYLKDSGVLEMMKIEVDEWGSYD